MKKILPILLLLFAFSCENKNKKIDYKRSIVYEQTAKFNAEGSALEKTVTALNDDREPVSITKSVLTKGTWTDVNEIRYEYNKNGNILKTTHKEILDYTLNSHNKDIDAHKPQVTECLFMYGNKGKRRTLVVIDGEKVRDTVFRYNPVGSPKISEIRQFVGNKFVPVERISFEYDEQDDKEIVTETKHIYNNDIWEEAETTTKTYEGIFYHSRRTHSRYENRRLIESDNGTLKCTYEYDDNDNLLSMNQISGEAGTAVRKNVFYDEIGNDTLMLMFSLEDGKQIGQKRRNVDGLKEVWNWDNKTEKWNLADRVEFRVQGYHDRVEVITYFPKAERIYMFDYDERLVLFTEKKDKIIATEKYDYSPNGEKNIETKTFKNEKDYEDYADINNFTPPVVANEDDEVEIDEVKEIKESI